MRRIKKVFLGIAVFAMVLAGLLHGNVEKAYAASANITISSDSTIVGGDVDVVVRITSDEVIYMCDFYLQYNSSILEPVSGHSAGGGGTVRVLSTDKTGKSVEFTIRFKTKAAGTSDLKIVTDNTIISSELTDRLDMTTSGGKITVQAPVSYSSDNKLSSLSVSPGTMTPAFSPDVLEYKMDVSASCNRLVVSAVANDSKAKVSVSGAELKAGTNTTSITVTAENGTKRVYKIITTKPETPTQSVAPTPKKIVNINNENYEINEEYTISQLPDGFEVADIDFNGEPLAVGKNAAGLVVMFLEHTVTGVGEFYIYDTVNKSFIPYIRVDQNMSGYIVLDITDEMEKPAGSTLTEANIGGRMVKALKIGYSELYIFCAMNSAGTTGWYSFDPVEGTIQRYVDAPFVPGTSTESSTEAGDGDDSSDKDGSTKDGMWKDIAVGAIIVALVMTVLAFIFMAKSSKAGKQSSNVVAAGGDDKESGATLEKTSETSDDEEEEDEDEYDDEELLDEEYDEEFDEDEFDDTDYDVADDLEEDDGDILLDGDEDVINAEEPVDDAVEELEVKEIATEEDIKTSEVETVELIEFMEE